MIETQKISQILKTSKAVKTTGDLVKFDEKGEIIGYCAIGVLSCHKNNYKNRYDYNKRGISSYRDILRLYDIPNDLIYMDFTEELDFRVPDFKNKNLWGEVQKINIHGLPELIYRLNDQGDLTFKQIGEFLETCLDL